MFILFKKELTILSSSIQGPAIPVVYLLISGLFLWVFPGSFNIPGQGYSDLTGLFTVSPVLFLILIPALCMRSFAEEKKTGTEELLFIRPVTVGQIVFSKFLAVSSIILFSLLLTGIYWISIGFLGSPLWNIDSGAAIGGYAALILTALLFVSVGEFASSLTGNQIIAFVAGIFFCTLFYWGFELFSSILPGSEWQLLIRNIGVLPHYQTLCRGIVDSRDVIYFIVWILFFSALTIRIHQRTR
ncbi:MAG: ABC transporter permease subunit [Candidatus Azobacteroides sp.]|nr:ABC transporter permease subunit [Candidatus Azobacteroides sp.]